MADQSDSKVRARWRGKLAIRAALRKAARVRLRAAEAGLAWARRNDRHPRQWRVDAVEKARRTLAKRQRQVDFARRVIARHTPTRKKLTETVAFDGVPMFRGLALMLEDARHNGWNGLASSADRREGIPERYGKMSQARLYAGWIARQAGFNPANRPGRSTHELRSDGVAYAGPVGRPLKWWQLGLDTSDYHDLRAILDRLGYSPFRPYSAGSEVHHTNLRRSPTKNLRRRGLA